MERMFQELFQGITLIKMIVGVCMVVGLSVLAEVVSPKMAGVLSGYPLGAAITLFFIGFEVSPHFAAQSSVYTLIGLIATQTFAYSYYTAARFSQNSSKTLNLLFSCIGGLLGYFIASVFLQKMDVHLPSALLLSSLAVLLFIQLFKRVENVPIGKKVKTGIHTLLLRAFVAACIIVVITSSAKAVGPRWAGLFSAFPTTLLPFVLIVHFTYTTEHASTILKNVPKGIGSLIVYTVTV